MALLKHQSQVHALTAASYEAQIQQGQNLILDGREEEKRLRLSASIC